MRGITHLLLLAAFVLLGRCQQKPHVTMSPELKVIFKGDLFYLKCSGKSNVIWYFNEKQLPLTNDTWKIGVAAREHSGKYQCESNQQKSEDFHIEVKEYVPIASLTIKTGHPVVRSGDSVLLQLDNEDGLQGWMCRVYRGEKSKKIKLKIKNNTVSVVFQVNRLNVPETIYWCSNDTQRRSNQITLRTSDKDISLEMYPMPAVVGETLTLKCLAWGTNQISHTDFYKDNDILPSSASPTHTISNVTESAMGRYRCEATFTYINKPAGAPYQVTSDDQDVYVQVRPSMRAFLSSGMSCSCPRCPNSSPYHWYKYEDQQWAAIGSSPPKSSGTYACRAVWKIGRSSLSNAVYINQPPILIIVLCVMAGLGCILVAVVYFRCFRKRTGAIYEDLPLRSGDEKYEMLQKGAQREGEYDFLQAEATGGQRGTEEYEALNKDEIKEGVYHTVKIEGAVGAEGGYEALNKDGMTGGEYHTVKIKGEVGAEGGYEALKKEGMTGGEYQTLGMEGTGGGELGGKKDKD